MHAWELYVPTEGGEVKKIDEDCGLVSLLQTMCCSWNSVQLIGTYVSTKVLARPFPKGTVPFGSSNVPFGSATKETMCPLAPPQNQPIFNSHLNYLNLKTVWALSIELSEHWTQLKCFVDSGTHATNVFGSTITTFKMRVMVMRYICALWPVNFGENTGQWPN